MRYHSGSLNYDNDEPWAATAEECRRLCQKTPRCQFGQWEADAEEDRRCLLKYRMSSRVDAASVTTAFPRCGELMFV